MHSHMHTDLGLVALDLNNTLCTMYMCNECTYCVLDGSPPSLPSLCTADETTVVLHVLTATQGKHCKTGDIQF